MKPIALFALAGLIAAAPADRPSAAVTEWARTAAVPLEDDARVLSTIGDSRVLALGEFAHGAQEPLLLRNRLIRLLAERGRLDIVALESGMVEGRRLNDFVQGGPGTPEAVARNYLNWGFGLYPENVELLRWLRAYNARAGVRRIAIHGVDVPGGTDYAFGDASIAAADSVAWLRRAAPTSDEELIAALTPYAQDFGLKRWFALPPSERAALPKLAERLVAFHARRRVALAAATSAEEEAWAERTALVFQQIVGIFAVWPADNQGGKSPKGMYGPVQARDAAMAANMLWLLRRARPGARMLLFMHNGHVASAPRLNPPIPGVGGQFTVIGERLRTAIGKEMTVVLTNTATAPPSAKAKPNAPGSLGAALAAVGPRPFLVDLRRAPSALALDRGWMAGENLLPDAGAEIVPLRAAELVATFPGATDVVPLADHKD